MPPDSVGWIDQPEHIRVLASPVRQEIVDTLSVSGACTVATLAHELGVPADSLYYHVRKLAAAGLIVEDTSWQEVRYRLPSGPVAFRYTLSDPENVEAVGDAIASMLRMTTRDFRSALQDETAVVEGEGRTLWASRVRAWLSEGDVVEINALLHQLAEICSQPRREDTTQLCALTWVLAPLQSKPIRRGSKTGDS